jgi:hypothetical protein
VDDTSLLLGIIELINYHIDRAIESDIKREMEARRIWCNWLPSNNARLYQRIWEKADIYDGLVTRQKVPYVVSVFGEFTAALEIKEIRQCLFEDYGGLFNLRPMLSGVLFFEESGGDRYSFEYIRNHKAAIEIDLSSGDF